MARPPRDPRLVAPAAHATSEGAKRPSNPPLGARGLAVDKKKARRLRAWIVFLDETGLSESSPVRRTWAPRGETPVLTQPFRWKKLSCCGLLAYRFDGRRARLYFQIRPGAYDGPALLPVLRDLRHHLHPQRVFLVWDNLGAHKGRVMRRFLHRHRRWLHAVHLPPYAPHLNPVDVLWANVKGVDLANRCVKDLDEMAQAAVNGLERARRDRRLLVGCLHHTGLLL